jgi:hypothetical protein
MAIVERYELALAEQRLKILISNEECARTLGMPAPLASFNPY